MINIFYKIIKYFSKKEKDPKKIKLEILGISYNKTLDQNIYVVILGEENGERKIPIVINYYEAQAIAIEVEKIKPIVPFIYDTLKELMSLNKIKIEEILITDFKKDVLITQLVKKNKKVEIRIADALPLSIRIDKPIYIYEDVLIKVNEVVQKYYDIKDGKKIEYNKDDFEDYDINELNNLLKTAIDEEEYERASMIRDEILKKNKQKS